MMNDPIAALEQAHAALQNRAASAAALKLAAEEARGVVVALDAESELAPEQEAQVLRAMTSRSIVETLKALEALDDESASRALTRKIAMHLAGAIDVRVREVEAAEAARDPAEVRREQEHARREAQKEALFARVPALFRTDFMISKLGKAAWNCTPRPVGSHVSYIREFSVPRVLGQNVMESTRVPGWPPRHSDFAQIEQPNYMHDADEGIVGPLRRLCEKSSVYDDEVTIAIDRAQATLLKEFAQVCAAIRSHYPEGYPRFIALPSITTARALAAE